MDYPSIENFLGPIYSTGADSNYMDYTNPEFDRLLVEAAAATDAAAGQRQVPGGGGPPGAGHAGDPDVVHEATMGWSEKVATMKITAFGTIDLTRSR